MEIREEVGFVIGVRDYLVYLEGLPSVHIDDLIVNRNGGRAIVHSLEGNRVCALMLDQNPPKPGDVFSLKPDGVRIPLGNFLFGRTISPLGVPIDGREAVPLDGPKLELNVVAPPVSERQTITNQLFTGITLIDSLIPIGKGQRELIIGEARSGKSVFILDTIANQKNSGLVCIYTAIGKPEIDIKRLVNELAAGGSASYTIVVAATASAAAPLIAIAPDTAFTVAEFFCHRGRDVLLILDDLGIHSKYLREISLLTQEIPGRESYPGDIFYRHSHLMERAGRFKESIGGGSITLLPIIETAPEELTNLIPTNLMSQTDGHIFFSAALNAQGHYPAIEWERSVTRVGRQTQTTVQKLVGSQIRKLLTRFKEIEVFSKFDTEISAETRTLIKQAGLARQIIKQDPSRPIDPKVQIILLSLSFNPYFFEKGPEFFTENLVAITDLVKNSPELMELASQEIVDFNEYLEKLKAKSQTVEIKLMAVAKTRT